jgi:Fuc2NAc and GlcNAc transferase
LAVIITLYAGLTYLFYQNLIQPNLFYAFLCGLPISLIGFADDVFNLKPNIRFFVQFACTCSALYFLGGLHFLDLGIYHLQYATCNFILLILILFAFIAIIWSINLFNFLDGIDGYIGSEIVFIGIAIFLLSGEKIGLLLVTSASGFLIWNWPKAKIFMGDVGSTLLGFIVAVMAIYHQNNHILSIPVWLILTSVFWFDATITLFRRIKNKEKLSLAHRKHAYQRIVQAGFSHQKTTLWAFAINVAGLGLAWLANTFKTYSLAFLVLDILILLIILRIIDKKKPFSYSLESA